MKDLCKLELGQTYLELLEAFVASPTPAFRQAMAFHYSESWWYLTLASNYQEYFEDPEEAELFWELYNEGSDLVEGEVTQLHQEEKEQEEIEEAMQAMDDLDEERRRKGIWSYEDDQDEAFLDDPDF